MLFLFSFGESVGRRECPGEREVLHWCVLLPQKNCSIMVNSSNSVGGILSVGGANNNNNNSLPPPGKASKSVSSNSGVGSANDNDDRWILLSSPSCSSKQCSRTTTKKLILSSHPRVSLLFLRILHNNF